MSSSRQAVREDLNIDLQTSLSYATSPVSINSTPIPISSPSLSKNIEHILDL